MWPSLSFMNLVSSHVHNNYFRLYTIIYTRHLLQFLHPTSYSKLTNFPMQLHIVVKKTWGLLLSGSAAETSNYPHSANWAAEVTHWLPSHQYTRTVAHSTKPEPQQWSTRPKYKTGETMHCEPFVCNHRSDNLPNECRVRDRSSDCSQAAAPQFC